MGEALAELRRLSNRVARLRARVNSVPRFAANDSPRRFDVVSLNGNKYFVDSRVANEARSLIDSIGEVRRQQQHSHRMTSGWRRVTRDTIRSQSSAATNRRNREHSNAYINSRDTRSLLARESNGDNSRSIGSRTSISSLRTSAHRSTSLAHWSSSAGSRSPGRRGREATNSSASTLSESMPLRPESAGNFRSYLSDVLRSDSVPSEGREAQAIRIKLERMTLTAGSDADTECKRRAETCAICIAPLREEERCVLLSCRHVFHRACLSKWVSRRNSQWCPLCKRPI